MFFLKILANMYPLKINVGLAKVWRKIFFSGEDGLFHMKEFRTTLIYFYLFPSISICFYLSLSISIYLYPSLSISIYLYPSLSISIYLYLSPSISIYVSIYPSIFQLINLFINPSTYLSDFELCFVPQRRTHNGNTTATTKTPPPDGTNGGRLLRTKTSVWASHLAHLAHIL